jgi:succinylarginine dihydrolase
MASDAIEINFDGIVGPTHNYAGLSLGNLASQKHGNLASNPRQAALQGLDKMKFLMDLGVRQAVLPPQERPDVASLRRLGFTGNDAAVLEQAQRQAPELLAACGSASAMWAANAATVSPSCDSADGRVHFTPANLPTQFHRSLESATTSRVLRAIFPDESLFAHHPPLPGGPQLADEGAANHLRLAPSHGRAGVEMFVFGRNGFGEDQSAPTRFPARQTREASAAVARLHQLREGDVRFVRQNPKAIDAGAFHNDVVAVGNLNVLLYHESAFADFPADDLRRWFEKNGAGELHLIEVPERLISLSEAVASYLFNSQIVNLPDGTMNVIAPVEARESHQAVHCLGWLMGRKTPIQRVHFVDVRQSMNNGGGPACLRLRVALTPVEISRVNPSVLLDEKLFQSLRQWVQKHYREHLVPADLADPRLLVECRSALDELSGMLGLRAIYPFQCGG